jgi:hypothetical protein
MLLAAKPLSKLLRGAEYLPSASRYAVTAARYDDEAENTLAR